jgi:two-component system sensor histidine kinase CreC
VRIRTAIFAVYVAASAVGFAVLMRFMLAEVRPRYVASLRSSMSDSARLLAAAMENRPLPPSLESTRTGWRMRVIAGGGRVLLDSASVDEVPADYLATSSVGRSFATRVGERLLDVERRPLTEDEVSVAQPVKLAGGEIATIELSRPVRTVNALIWAERKKLAGISLAIAGAMLVCGWLIATRVTRSIDRLTLYVQRVRDGWKGPLPQSRAKEIAALARAFEEMRDALEGRQHAERYTQALAHEVKAPLAAIRGAAELLDEDMPAETRQQFLANIRGEAARIQQIIERLLELSSLEARKALRKTETVGVAELVEEAAQVMRPAAQLRGVRVSVRSGTHLTLRGERVLLREALVNLLQNATEFSPDDGEVRLSYRADAGGVEFIVEDDGPGVADFALPHVFERFYSLPRPGTKRKSTGLGLTLAREIAHLHGGEVALANRPQGGARARLVVRS